jgi:hypothetical protein
MDNLSQLLWGGLGLGNGIKVINMPLMRGSCKPRWTKRDMIKVHFCIVFCVINSQ